MSTVAVISVRGSITPDSEQIAREVDGLWYYEQVELGYNYGMTESPLATPWQHPDGYSARHIDVIRLVTSYTQGSITQKRLACPCFQR